MSEKDRFDWNDDVEFNAEADAMEDVGCFESSLEGFEDYDEMSDYDDSAPSDTTAEDAWAPMDGKESNRNRTGDPADEAEAPAESPAASEPEPGKPRRARITAQRGSGLSAVGVGILFAASILVAGIGVGGAVLFAEGVDPVSLWQPQNLLNFDQLLNFSEHPLNVIYMVSLGITLLALLGSYRMGKLAVEANARTRAAEEMLDKVCALRLDEQEAWRDESFKEFLPAEEFVIKTLGAWRLQEARQKRLLGVEGEIHRLEKALSGGERSDLTGRYDSPAVGRLVDEMLRHFDAREAAVAKAREVERRDEAAGQEMAETLREAHEWNWTTRDRVDEIGHEAARLDRTLADLAAGTGRTGTAADADPGDVLAAARRDLAALEKTLTDEVADRRATEELNDLVDRGSKLAFQIAMEVTRLGPRGDRLAPMSQSLEDLTTGIRKAVDGLPAMAGARQVDLTAQVASRLDALEKTVRSLREASGSELSGPLNRTAEAAARIAADLDALAADFATQDERIKATSLAVAELSGRTGEPARTPDRAVRPDTIEPLGPDRQEVPAQPDGPAPAGMELERAGEFSLGYEPAGEAPLPDEAEEVYDLDSFGASPLDPQDVAGDPDEEVYDLDGFGASPLDPQDDGADPDEEVFDLDQFGAEPVSGDAPDGEPVYEMADLGGTTVEQEQGADEPVMDLDAFGAVPLDEPGDGPSVEDGVFDLEEFGAKPLN